METTCRFVMKKVYVIEGRQLVKQIRNSCERCRYLIKRTIDMAMAPVSIYNLTIAPAFFFTQLDLSGPYLTYSPQHKRTTIKVWLIVFCCCSTSAVHYILSNLFWAFCIHFYFRADALLKNKKCTKISCLNY